MVARRAHNPEVVGSNPAPAPKIKGHQIGVLFGLFVSVVFELIIFWVMRPMSVARWGLYDAAAGGR